MKAHDLRDALLAGKVFTSFDVAEQERSELDWLGIAEAIHHAHKFEAQYEDVLDDENLRMTAVDLWRANILRPPYDLTYVEIDGPANGGFREAILARHDRERNETTLRIFAWWREPRFWVDTGCSTRTNYALDPPEALIVIPDPQSYREGTWDLNRRTAQFALSHFMTLCCFMSTKHSRLSPVEPPAALNRQRERKGRSPIYSHHAIDLSPEIAERATADGTHASPRLHWRRGHVRTLPSGTQVGVKPHLVGLAERGFVSKDYRVLPPVPK